MTCHTKSQKYLTILNFKRTINRHHTKMTEMLELLDKEFKAAIMKMLHKQL